MIAEAFARILLLKTSLGITKDALLLCHIAITPSPSILQQPVDYPISAHYKEMVLLPDGYSQLLIHSPSF